jgi:hypothetical protein
MHKDSLRVHDTRNRCKKEQQKHTTVGIRMCSPTILLTYRRVASRPLARVGRRGGWGVLGEGRGAVDGVVNVDKSTVAAAPVELASAATLSSRDQCESGECVIDRGEELTKPQDPLGNVL